MHVETTGCKADARGSRFATPPSASGPRGLRRRGPAPAPTSHVRQSKTSAVTCPCVRVRAWVGHGAHGASSVGARAAAAFGASVDSPRWIKCASISAVESREASVESRVRRPKARPRGGAAGPLGCPPRLVHHPHPAPTGRELAPSSQRRAKPSLPSCFASLGHTEGKGPLSC